MKKIILCVLLCICLIGVNVVAEDKTLPFSLSYNNSLVSKKSSLDLINGLDYDFDSNELVFDSAFDSTKPFLLTLDKALPNNSLNIVVSGNITIDGDLYAPLNTGDNKVYLKLVDNDSSFTLKSEERSYFGLNPIYKYDAAYEYDKDIEFIDDASYNFVDKTYKNGETDALSVTFNNIKADFNNVAEIDGTLIKRVFDGLNEDGDEEFEAIKGFVVTNDVTKTVAYENNNYDVKLKDFGDDNLYIELLFKDIEVFNIVDKCFVDGESKSVIDDPEDDYLIETSKNIEGTMYKDELNNYYFSYFITMKPKTLNYKDFSMKLSGLNDSYKYINIKFITSEIIPPNSPNNKLDYIVPNTSVR